MARLDTPHRRTSSSPAEAGGPPPPWAARTPFAPVALGDGLVLRAAGPTDVDGVVALNVALFGEQDGPGVHELLTGPLPVEWLVVVDEAAAPAPAVAAACARIPHRFHLDGVAVPGSQIEFVTTEERYRGRGLVRRLFEAHHQRAAAEGEQLQVVIGIPYLYRKLGYGYALDAPVTVALDVDRLARLEPPAQAAGATTRLATTDDLAWLVEVEGRRGRAGLTIVRDEATYASWLRRSGPLGEGAWEALLVAEEHGAPVGWARLQVYVGEGALQVLHGWCPTAEVAERLLARSAVIARGLEGRFDRRVEAVAADVAGTPWSVAVHRHGDVRPSPSGAFGRTPDPVGLLRTLTPALERRLAASGLAADRGEVTISLYDRSVRLAWEGGALTAVEPAPADPDPFEHGGVGVAPDWFPALVLGRWGASALAERVDDVLLGQHAPALDVLFPARPHDLATI